MSDEGRALPTDRDRSIAAANHIVSIFFPLMGPIIVLAISWKRSRFVAEHAIAAIFDELLMKAILLIGGAISLAFTIMKVTELIQSGGQSFSWDLVWQAALKVAITWLIVLVVGIIVTIRTIWDAYLAYKGEWPDGWLSSRVAKRLAAKLT